MRKLRRGRNNKDQTVAELSEELDLWFAFFNRNDTRKTILKEKDPLLYSECSELKVKKDSVKKMENKKDIEDKNEEDQCVCDYDVNCQFCRSIWEAEKDLIQIYKMTDEEEKAENEGYKLIHKALRQEKRQEIVRKSKLPMDPLPERELCEYEKIRENIIAQRKKEWALKEAEWEAEWDKGKH